MIRPDLSKSLIHLTRDRNDVSAENIFDKIITENAILGSTENIRGGHNCICFSETPISAIGQVIALNDDGFHYGSYGFMFSKRFLYDIGARPVIYQPDSDYDLLPESLQYRHVRFDLNKSDWTWEREWRICADKLDLEPQFVTLIVPNRNKIEEYKEKVYQRNRMLAMVTDGFLTGKNLEWHFIALDDLGF